MQKAERELHCDENTELNGLSQGSDRVLYWDYHHHVKGGMLINRFLLAQRKLPSVPSTNQLHSSVRDVVIIKGKRL
jgi:hypothetical protein